MRPSINEMTVETPIARLIKIVVEVWQHVLILRKLRLTFAHRTLAQRYTIKSKVMFREEDLEAHLAFGSDSEEWEMSVFPRDVINGTLTHATCIIYEKS